MKYLMYYTSAPDFAETAPLHIAGHRQRLAEFHARGTLLMAGPIGDPYNGDALGVFATRESVVEFIEGDPFVIGGVVLDWHIREWHEVLIPGQSARPADA